MLLDFGRFELQSSLLTDFPVQIQAPFVRKELAYSSVVDPQWFQWDPDPAFLVNVSPGL